MLYFSYGSNMSLHRIGSRVPSAKFVAVSVLENHELKFHKISKDGSGKCDAYETGQADRCVIGVVFDISSSEKSILDRKEGLGYGYDEKIVQVRSTEGALFEAVTYYATKIDPNLIPYHWYKEHVIRGAKEHGLPNEYIQLIESIKSISDPNKKRNDSEMAIYRETL